jgi:hypothetical protein
LNVFRLWQDEGFLFLLLKNLKKTYCRPGQENLAEGQDKMCALRNTVEEDGNLGIFLRQ